jgi:glutathione S-transferase
MPALKLYELDNVEGEVISPFVWRIKFALQHKGISYDSVPVGFFDLRRIGHRVGEPGTLMTLPIVEYAGTFLSESWVIAEWLDEAFPDHPRLEPTPRRLRCLSVRPLTRFRRGFLLVPARPMALPQR